MILSLNKKVYHQLSKEKYTYNRFKIQKNIRTYVYHHPCSMIEENRILYEPDWWGVFHLVH